ncbi:MAG TPA: sigma-70 family RNA polymerase sigma factor [Acidimicrobiales bacterium]|nr:sigma-70 family RNA polymerase sigma factor [Acidimicrobiales bacterium]
MASSDIRSMTTSRSSAASPADLTDKFRTYASTRDERLRVELTEAYLPLAASLASRYAGRSEPIEDLEQAASLALVKAIDRFEPDRGVAFSTYAWATISGELKRHLRDRTWGLRVPRRLQEHFLVTARAADELHQDLGRPPTVSELSTATGLDIEETIQALEVRSAHRLPSVEGLGRNSESDQVWEPGSVDPSFDEADDQDMVARLMEHLPESDRELLRLRFAEQLSQSEIAARFGVSQMHVSRRLSRTLDRLRTLAGSPA